MCSYKAKKIIQNVILSIFMVKLVCYDILEVEIDCNKSYICSTCITFIMLDRV